MNLISRLEELEQQTLIKSCKVASILESLDPETKEILERVLKSKVSNSAISAELTREGYEVGRTTVGLHRSNRCSCGGKS